jgi:hypothetical protein
MVASTSGCTVVVCKTRLHRDEVIALDMLEKEYLQMPDILYKYLRQEVVASTATTTTATSGADGLVVTRPLIIVLASTFLVRAVVVYVRRLLCFRIS